MRRATSLPENKSETVFPLKSSRVAKREESGGQVHPIPYASTAARGRRKSIGPPKETVTKGQDTQREAPKEVGGDGGLSARLHLPLLTVQSYERNIGHKHHTGRSIHP